MDYHNLIVDKLKSMDVNKLIGEIARLACESKDGFKQFHPKGKDEPRVDVAEGNQCDTDNFNQARRKALQVGCLSFFVGTGRKNFPFSSQMMSTSLAGGWDKIVLNMDAGGGKTENIAMIAIQRALMGYKTIVSVSNAKDSADAKRKTDLIYKAFQASGLDCKVAVYEKATADKNPAKARRIFTDNQVVIMTQSDLQSRVLSDRLSPEKPVLPEKFSSEFQAILDESDKNYMFDGTNPTIMSGASDGKIRKVSLTNWIKDSRLTHIELLVNIAREFEKKYGNDSDGKYLWQKGEAMEFTKEGLACFEAIMKSELSKVKSVALRNEYRRQILADAGNMLFVMRIHKQGKAYELVDKKVRMINGGMRRFDWDSVQQEYVHLIEALHYLGSDEDRKGRKGSVKGISEGNLSSIGVNARQTMNEELSGYVMFSGTNIEMLDMWVQEYLETIAVEAHVAPTLKILPRVYAKNKDKQEAKVLESIAMSIVDGSPVLTHIPLTRSEDQLNIEEVQSKMETLMDYLEHKILSEKKVKTDADKNRIQKLDKLLDKPSRYNESRTNRTFAEGLYTQLGGTAYLEKYKKLLEYNKEYHGKVKQVFNGTVPDTMDINCSENRIYLETVTEGCTKEYETKAIERFGSGFKTILLSVNANRAVDIQPYNDQLLEHIKLNNFKAFNDKYGYKEHGAVGIMTELKKDEAYFIQEAFRLGRTQGIGRAQGKVIGIYSVDDALLKGYPAFQDWLKNFSNFSTTEGKGRDYAVLGLPDFPANAMLNIDRADFEEHLSPEEKAILNRVYDKKKVDSIKEGKTSIPKSVLIARGVDVATVDQLFEMLSSHEKAITPAKLDVSHKSIDSIKNTLEKNKVSSADINLYIAMLQENKQKLSVSGLVEKGIPKQIAEMLFKSSELALFIEPDAITVNEKTAPLIETFLVGKNVVDAQKSAILELMTQTDKIKKSEFDNALEIVEGSKESKEKLKKTMENYLYVKELVEVNVLTQEEAAVFIKYGMPESTGEPTELKIEEADIKAYKSLQSKVNKLNIETNMKIAAEIQQKAREGITSSKKNLEQTEKTTKTIHKIRDLMSKRSMWKKVEVNAKYEHVPIDEIHKIKDIPSLFTMFYDYALEQHNREFANLHGISVDEIFSMDVKDPKREGLINKYTKFISKKFGVTVSFEKKNIPASYSIFQKGFLQVKIQLYFMIEQP